MNAASVQCFLKNQPVCLSVMRLFHSAAVLVARYKYIESLCSLAVRCEPISWCCRPVRWWSKPSQSTSPPSKTWETSTPLPEMSSNSHRSVMCVADVFLPTAGELKCLWIRFTWKEKNNVNMLLAEVWLYISDFCWQLNRLLLLTQGLSQQLYFLTHLC